jgi:UDP-N-acetyl-D-mannosaminuronic acid dehydrogenase
VIGLGYIGLPTSALLANNGFMVLGVDISEEVVNKINQGKIHIKEPDLDSFVHAAVATGNFKALNKPQPSDIYIICVPTPFKNHQGEIPLPDLDFVNSAVDNISPILKEGDLIILESTSPVGTVDLIAKRARKNRPELDKLFFAYCPERVLPGKIIFELIQNDRIVGGLCEESTSMASQFYSQFVKGKIFQTDAKTAEMCKLVENSYRDVNIAFANELSILCEQFGVNPWNLIELANRHPRVNILQPGIGVGGHCIAVDPWFLVSAQPEMARLIHTSRQVNLMKTEWVIERIENQINQLLSVNPNASITCFGLSFKPDIDDLRESPAMEIYSKLKTKYRQLKVVEPNIEHFPDLVSFEEATEESDILIFLVKHTQFQSINLKKNQVIIDYCGLNLEMPEVD